MIVVGLLALAIFASLPGASAQDVSSYQVGAWGDDASRGNMGVQAEILTRIYEVHEPDLADSFWVGTNLDDGAFIQFGYYILNSGYYCLKGKIIAGQFTCSGGSETIGPSEARWFWQYWPKGTGRDYYSGTGPTGSAGMNGTWHLYSIMPNVNDSWDFVLDGRPVDWISVKWARSEERPHMVAEKVTSSSVLFLSGLGPVEFRNLAYLKQDGWHSVDSLTILKGCGTNTQCKLDNPYGMSPKGPNHIVAGSGIQTQATNGLLWTSSYVTLSVKTHSQTSFIAHWMLGSEESEGQADIEVPKGMFTTVFLLDTSVPAEGIFGVFGAVDEFQGWTGDESSSNATIRVLMNRDKTIQAYWSTNFATTLEYGEYLLLALVAVVIVALAYRRSRPRLASSQSTLDVLSQVRWAFGICRAVSEVVLSRLPRISLKANLVNRP